MTDEEAQGLRRENAYLKTRCAQLQDDVSILSGELARVTQQFDRVASRRPALAPDPLAGGR